MPISPKRSTHTMAFTNTSRESTDVDRVHKDSGNVDVEKQAIAEAHLKNTTVQSVSWRGVTVTVKDRVTKEPTAIVDNVEGIVEAGKTPRPAGSLPASSLPAFSGVPL